ncbi:pectin lyase fold/virulence factor [Boeremia exigua]|uniref:pectin lyase fold/virulence factor n=1 Tax=Boeremia exigua TaxID=749465 RepID=UPI001E8D74C3|nr:pectin lyase fold/virulence factor [Boeremia exigua]KAH6639470.1 pectin lyase fold/virulence factor [Boeremia exigua]
MLFRLPVVAILASLTDALSKNERITPPRGALVVDASGKLQDSYRTVGAAVAALANTTSAQAIYIAPGIYTEQVYIPSLNGPLTVQGYTEDARSYKDNQVTITGNLSRQVPGLANNDATATVRLWTSNVKLYNLNIANTFGAAKTGGQALALSAQNTNQGFYGCNFTGYQDTVYANEGRQIYAKTFINGAVDFIFGLRASAWFDKVDIESIGPGYITANGREAANNTSIYVFNKADVRGTNLTYLGRPWRQYSRTIFQRSFLGDVVRPEGWTRWDDVQPVTNVVYQEYKNYGPGAAGPRANFSSQLSKPINMEDVFGRNFEKEVWVDSEYF